MFQTITKVVVVAAAAVAVVVSAEVTGTRMEETWETIVASEKNSCKCIGYNAETHILAFFYKNGLGL